MADVAVAIVKQSMSNELIKIILAEITKEAFETAAKEAGNTVVKKTTEAVAKELSEKVAQEVIRSASEIAIGRTAVKHLSGAAAKEASEVVVKQASRSARKAIEKTCEIPFINVGKTVVEKASETAVKETSEVAVKKVGKNLTKNVIKGATVALTGVFLVLDIKDLVNNLKSLNEVSAISTALNEQAEALENGIDDIKEIRKQFEIKLKLIKAVIETLEKMKKYITKPYEYLKFYSELNKIKYGTSSTSDIRNTAQKIKVSGEKKVKIEKMRETEKGNDEEEDEEEEDEKDDYVEVLVATLNINALTKRKISFVKEMLEDKKPDILCLTETKFLNTGKEASKQISFLSGCCPPGYVYNNFPFKKNNRSKGVAMIINSSKFEVGPQYRYDYNEEGTFSCGLVPLTLKNSKKVVNIQAGAFYVTPWKSNPDLQDKRLVELVKFYKWLMNKQPSSNGSAQPIETILAGDFNVHVNKESECLTKAFNDLNTVFGYEVHPTAKEAHKTHRKTNILDLIISKSSPASGSVKVFDKPYNTKNAEGRSTSDHFWVQETVVIKIIKSDDEDHGQQQHGGKNAGPIPVKH